jgi:hypothetical protein
MFVKRERFLLLAAALAACHKPASDRSEAPAASAAAVAPSDVPPGPSVAALPGASASATTAAPSSSAPTVPDASLECAAVVKRNNELLVNLSGDCKSESQPPDQKAQNMKWVRSSLVELGRNARFNFCHGGHGTWMVRVLTVGLSAPSGESGGCGPSVSYELVFVSSSGERTTSKPRTWEDSDETTRSEVAAQFDFDGDGRDELLLDDMFHDNGSPPFFSMEVLRAKGSVVEDYPVGFHVDQTTDADGDGRPDFVTNTYFSAAGKCAHGTGNAADMLGVPLLVHSLPGGTFTMSDDVARRWAKRECPTAPRALQSTVEVSCSRLWGRAADEIARDAPDATQDCEFPYDVRAFVRRPPPFQPLSADAAPPLPGAKWERLDGQYSEKKGGW